VKHKRSVNVNLSFNGAANANLENYGILRSNFLKATGISIFPAKLVQNQQAAINFAKHKRKFLKT
jgi:hypothetical protein